MERYPRIEYRLVEFEAQVRGGATGPLQFDAVGALTVAGTTQTITCR